MEALVTERDHSGEPNSAMSMGFFNDVCNSKDYTINQVRQGGLAVSVPGQPYREDWSLCTSPQLDVFWKLLPSSASWQKCMSLAVRMCMLFTDAA